MASTRLSRAKTRSSTESPQPRLQTTGHRNGSVQLRSPNAQEKSRIAKRRYYIRPKLKISEERVRTLIRSGVDPEVAKINLEPIKLELQADLNWAPRRCEVAELEYKRFLTLQLWNRNLPYPLVPTFLIDQIWHKHILDTGAYQLDMDRLFGEYLHHFPYLGFGSEKSKRLKQKAFVLTCKLYQKTFGESFIESAKRLKKREKRIPK